MRLITKLAGKLSLRTVLIVLFVLQIVGTVGLVGYLSYRSRQKAVNDLGHQLINEVDDRVEHYLNTYRSTPQLINRINADAIREGTLDLQNLSKLERHMFVQLLQFNSVTSIVIGNEQGDFRAYSNSLRLHLLRSDPSNTSKIYDQGNETKSQAIGDKSNSPCLVSSTVMSIPPMEELTVLYEAANIGGVKEVEQEIIRLQQLNPDYTFFTIRILELAQNFDYEEIVKFIDDYPQQIPE